MLELHQQKAAASGDALSRLETEIGKQDEDINELVYELYGLDEEEIAIVGASVAG